MASSTPFRTRSGAGMGAESAAAPRNVADPKEVRDATTVSSRSLGLGANPEQTSKQKFEENNGASRTTMPTTTASNSAAPQWSFAELARMLQEALDDSTVVFHVAQTEPVGLNLAIFELWLLGLREDKVVYYRRSLLGNEPDANERQLLLFLYRDAVDQYRLFELLEEYLLQPHLLRRQMLIQLSPRVQQYLVSKYYEFDDRVYREILGRKLTARARKDLDEVAESTNVRLPNCRRQFDNLRRIYSSLDERNFEGNITGIIADQYYLPWALAERFTCIIFLLFNKFHPLSAKKRTMFLSLRDLEYCAALMLIHWVAEVPSAGSSSYPQTFTGRQYFESIQIAPSNSTDDGAHLGDEEGVLDQQQDGSSENGDDDEAASQDDSEESDSSDIETRSLRQIAKASGNAKGSVSEPLPSTSSHQHLLQLQQDQQNTSGTNLSGNAVDQASIPMRTQTSSLLLRPGNTSLEICPALIARWRYSKSHILNSRDLLDEIVKTAMRDLGNTVGTKWVNGYKKLRHKGRYKSWVKSLVSIGAGLGQAKELRDFFEDISQELCESIQSGTGLPLNGFRHIIEATNRSFLRHNVMNPELLAYMEVMSPICLHLYSKSSNLQ